MANDQHISWFVEQLEQVEHLSRVRIHTRLPVVIPNRLTGQLATTLGKSRLKAIIVLHINHANEIDDILKQKLLQYKQQEITLLNQAVLLKGINDDLKTQVNLSEKLFEAGIVPYYLHLLDKVEGAAHFEVSEQKAKDLIAQMLTELPGFLMPKLVREIAEQPSKTPV
jgi:KamA family protein